MNSNSSFNAAKCKANRRRVCCICLAIKEDANTSMLHMNITGCTLTTTHTHTHSFNGPFSGTTQVSRYQKGKTNLDFTEARDREWQWHQLDHMQVCTLLQRFNHTSTPPLVFTGQMPFLSPNQQRQSTEGKYINY